MECGVASKQNKTKMETLTSTQQAMIEKMIEHFTKENSGLITEKKITYKESSTSDEHGYTMIIEKLDLLKPKKKPCPLCGKLITGRDNDMRRHMANKTHNIPTDKNPYFPIENDKRKTKKIEGSKNQKRQQRKKQKEQKEEESETSLDSTEEDTGEQILFGQKLFGINLNE
jgi:hypothetical protein